MGRGGSLSGTCWAPSTSRCLPRRWEAEGLPPACRECPALRVQQVARPGEGSCRVEAPMVGRTPPHQARRPKTLQAGPHVLPCACPPSPPHFPARRQQPRQHHMPGPQCTVSWRPVPGRAVPQAGLPVQAHTRPPVQHSSPCGPHSSHPGQTQGRGTASLLCPQHMAILGHSWEGHLLPAAVVVEKSQLLQGGPTPHTWLSSKACR